MDWVDKISQFWPHLAVGFHLLAALLASAHALLNKRDSRAATLWIAFIWLMPALGPLLYLVLGVNRIRRRALILGVHKPASRSILEDLEQPEHEGTEHLKLLARVVSRLVAEPLTAGNRVQPLVNGDKAFPSMPRLNPHKDPFRWSVTSLTMSPAEENLPMRSAALPSAGWRCGS